ncbi:MAG: hypothetical protein C7B47_04135 [Sulfobacillus thermosulfidooxidans]|uniref:Uncharacterized protein n=1 Tax=Sulfobacillus thermosulfidooxidans TaxID=28034 RepID=A0A2T2X2U0_SULTH|nr:MAG: hypothetical protein C7B47_04135 [Sulfobacillus thermosulfidooxidans]
MAIAGQKRVRLRWNWKRFVTVFVLGYLSFWTVQSGIHIWVLWHDELTLNHNIQAVQTQNAKLQQDIQELKNPVMVKNMITGKMAIPDPALNQP